MTHKTTDYSGKPIDAFFCDFCGENIKKSDVKRSHFEGKHICRKCRMKLKKWLELES